MFDLGHALDVATIRETSGRVLSQDGAGGWVLWDPAAKSIVARGAGSGAVQMAGSVFLVGVTGAVELRDGGDGHLVTSIALTSSPSTYGVATDGSYVWVRSSTDLQVWSPAGAHLFTHAGSYANSVVFAAPGQLRIGDPSRQTLEYVDSAGGASTTSATFAGAFSAWFDDGARFFTAVGTTVRIYSKDAAQEALTSLPTTQALAGHGGYFWTYQSTAPYALAIYTVAAPAAPAATFNQTIGTRVIPAGDLLGVLPFGTPSLTLVHLDPGGLSTEDVPIPSAYLQAFGADAAGNWSVGNMHGVVYDRANLLASKGPLSCGKVFAVDGATTGLAAVGTDGGGVLTFQAGPTGFTFQGAVPYKGSRVQLSADGSVLAVQYDGDSQYWVDMSLRVFSLPGRTEIHAWPFQYDPAVSTYYSGISLARGGTRLGQVERTFMPPSPNPSFKGTVTDLMGNVTLSTDMGQGGAALYVSPDGTLVAAVDTTGAATQIFKNGTLVDAAQGIPSGWLDDDRLLVQFFMPNFPNNTYLGTAIHTVSTGTNGPTLQLPCTASGFGVIDASHVLCEVKHPKNWNNAIYDLGTASAAWTGSTNAYGLATVAGGYVVFPDEDRLYVEAYAVP